MVGRAAVKIQGPQTAEITFFLNIRPNASLATCV